VSSGRVVWNRENWCTKCDYAFAEHGGPPVPEDIRVASLARDGQWMVTFTDMDKWVSLAQALKKIGWSHAQVVALKAGLPGVLFLGLRAEAQCLLGSLTSYGVPVSLQRVSDPSA
jgi:hypothetical protein